MQNINDSSKIKWGEWNELAKEKKLTFTLRQTLELFIIGKTIDEIMEKRDFKRDTVEKQIIDLITKSFIDVKDLVSSNKVKEILKILEEGNCKTLTEIKNILGDEYSWFEIKCVIAHKNSFAKSQN